VKPHPSFVSAALFFALAIGLCQAQAQTPAPASVSLPAPSATSKQATPVRSSDRRRAIKLYLASSKLFEQEQFEEAMRGYERAAALDPSNPDYGLSAGLARSHAVTALIQAAAKDRNRGDAATARAALAHALELDPKNEQATEHLNELGDDQLLDQLKPLYEQAASRAGTAPKLAVLPGTHTFHLRTDQRQAIQQVFKAYGIAVSFDDSIRNTQVRFDVDDAGFAQTIRALSLLTQSFHVPLDAHRVLVARDTPDNRTKYLRQQVETLYLPGLSSTELTDVGNLAKNVFEVSQSAVEPTQGSLTVRAPEATLEALNGTLHELLDGRNQVLLDVRMIQLAHTNERNTGAQLPQQMGVFNVAAEAESIFNANQSLVNQIISSGLAAPGDYMAILAILLASGQVSNPLLSNGFATFGGNLTNCTNGLISCKGALTTFGLSPGTGAINLNLNSSDSRELDQIQLRLGDGETGTLKTGTRYPITTSSFSSLSGSTPNIPGLTGAGNSSSLSSLLSSYLGSSVPQVPMVEYQDLGLTLKTTPKVMRGSEVALTVDLKITALAGQTINSVPVLNNRSYSGVVTLKQGEAVVVVSEVDTQESKAISGMPGITEIPGMSSLTGNDTSKNTATLLIVMTPHVIRGTQAAGHSPMMRIERNTQAH
jgi:hypothetical protein